MVSKQEHAYHSIRARILDGRYGPGHRLVIDRLARELAVSALPVREAVRRLEAEGLVLFHANSGAQVTPADPARYAENLEVLALLEGFATARAAELDGAALTGELTAETDRMAACLDGDDVLGFAQANQRFHRVVHAACGNPPLIELLDRAGRRLDAIRQTVFVHIPYRGVSSIAEHRELIELIAAGAPGLEIEAAARAHKLATLAAFREWLATPQPAATRESATRTPRRREQSAGPRRAPTPPRSTR